MHHFLPPALRQRQVHPAVVRQGQQGIEQPHHKRQVYPSMQLGGTPPQLLIDQVRDGTVDVVWTLLATPPAASR